MNPRIKILIKRSNGFIRIVGMHNKKSAGYLTIWTDVTTNSNYNFNWIVSLYVKPKYRNLGLAKKLIQTAKNISNKNLLLRAKPYKDHSKRNNVHLIQMYRSFGFSQMPKPNNNILYYIKK